LSEEMNVLSKEQLQDAARCNERMTCDGCRLKDVPVLCREACAKTALHYMDKCERQAAVLRQAREAMEQIVNKYQPIGGKIHAAIAAIAAIDGEGKENG
jgi:hypothetical protein